jgi:hypothetical protein
MQVSLTAGQSAHATRVRVGPLLLIFSFETVVAFHHPETGWVACKNVWSKTTGRHLNQEVPEGTVRYEPHEFEARLETVLSQLDGATA